MPTRTYWLEPTDRVATGLRRYSRRAGDGWDCANGYHQALAWTGEEPARFEDGTYFRRHLALPDPVDHGDPRWPARCADCDYAFADDDAWQEWQELLYTRADTGATVVLHQRSVPPGAEPADPGASFDAWWYPDDWRGADGIALVVCCPTPGLPPELAYLQEWGVDRPASSGAGRWARTGDPRLCDVTASPSIAIGVPGRPGYYHGWLNAGVLSDHVG